MTGAMEKIKAKVENVLHKDKDTTHDTTTGTHAGSHTTGTHTTGTHTGPAGTHTTHNDPTGPHSSHTANAADPRVDSDRVGGVGNTTSAGGYGTTGTHGTTGSNLTGSHNTHGTTGSGLTGSHTHGSDPTGPHDSHLANKADPRVDSDRVGGIGNTSSAGGYGTTGTHGTTGSGLTGSHNTHGTTGSGLTGSHNTHGTTATTGHSNTRGSDPTGPHDSHLANKLDPRVDSDRYGAAGNTGSARDTHGSSSGKQHADFHKDTAHHTGNEPLPEALVEDKSRAGAHGSLVNPHTEESLARKSVTGGSGLTGSHAHGSDPTGPHDSHLANKADPRVDSDRYGAAGNTAGAGGYGTTGSGLTGSHNTHGTTGSGLTGSHNTHGTTGGLGGSHNTYGSDPTGPHDSRMANKADPRVDSDRYGAAGNTAGAGYGNTSSGLTGTHGTTGSGLTGSHGTAGGYGTTGSGLTGSHNTHGTTGGLGGSHNTYGSDPTGPHDSRMANQADPRVDSDRVGGAGNTYGTHQSGGLTGNNHPGQVGNPNANKTAGPHGSDLLNKLDPRVDSDLNGSKTVGGDKTYTN